MATLIQGSRAWSLVMVAGILGHHASDLWALSGQSAEPCSRLAIRSRIEVNCTVRSALITHPGDLAGGRYVSNLVSLNVIDATSVIHT
jgi:hypothetical protein